MLRTYIRRGRSRLSQAYETASYRTLEQGFDGRWRSKASGVIEAVPSSPIKGSCRLPGSRKRTLISSSSRPSYLEGDRLLLHIEVPEVIRRNVLSWRLIVDISLKADARVKAMPATKTASQSDPRWARCDCEPGLQLVDMQADCSKVTWNATDAGSLGYEAGRLHSCKR